MDESEPRLLRESGLSEHERRQIRKKQRALYKQLEEKDRVDIDEMRNENNIIFCNVRYTREAVLDGENVGFIAKRTSRQIDQLVQVPRYDAERLANKLSRTFRTNDTFDWQKLGRSASVCFHAVPNDVSFLNGPLMDGHERPVKERKKPVRQQVDEETAAEQKPQNVDQTKTVQDVDQLSAIESSMRVLQKTLKKNVNDGYRNHKSKIAEITGEETLSQDLSKKLRKHGVGIDAIRYLFNPNSFTQTVENIFHFSFLIKKGSATIGLREPKKIEVTGKDGNKCEVELWKGGPYVKHVDDKINVDRPPARQTIVTLTMKDWREMCKVYGVEKGDLPHRTGSKFEALSPTLKKRKRNG